jgi:hypothetical protein
MGKHEILVVVSRADMVKLVEAATEQAKSNRWCEGYVDRPDSSRVALRLDKRGVLRGLHRDGTRYQFVTIE